MRVSSSLVVAAVAVAGALALHAHAATSQVVTLDTRPGVRQAFLLLEPDAAAKDVVILFPADEGVVDFRETADGWELERQGGGLTTRKPMREVLRKRGYAVAIVGVPSDRVNLAPDFRRSAEHAADIRSVIAFLHARYPGKVYLHGHCLGSLSAASVASRLKSDGIAGVILSSTRSQGRDGAVTDFERGTVTVPVLLVQHSADSCPFTPPNNVGNVKAFYESSTPRVDLVMVSGGDGSIPTKQKCRNGFHGFKGVERETAQAIASWLQGKEFPAVIDGDAR